MNCIPTKVLKCTAHILSPIICHLINASVTKGIFPDCLKLARVVPLYKCGDSFNISNYRPISVLNIFSKLIEKHAFKYLHSYVERNGILDDCQYGFRHGRGTNQAILRHVNYIYDKLDENQLVFSMYMDFRKAFDSVDHKILLDKLNFYGVRGIPFLWFKSYLGDRKQFVNVNGVNSDTILLTHSVPQGSNLGPLLFLIYINDLPNCSNFFKYTLFADDCTISCPVQRGNLNLSLIHI